MLILIDGISGSGKTTLANQLGELLQIPVLHLDSWYPGWHGLEAASRITEEIVAGRADSYVQWDWAQERPGETISFDRSRGLIIEGCGAITATSAPLVDLRIWIEADPELAKNRASLREGTTDLDWWDLWQKQEQHHWAINSPWAFADVTVQARA